MQLGSATCDIALGPGGEYRRLAGVLPEARGACNDERKGSDTLYPHDLSGGDREACCEFTVHTLKDREGGRELPPHELGARVEHRELVPQELGTAESWCGRD